MPTTTRLRYARGFRGRVNHLVRGEATQTMCGLDARGMAKWTLSERGSDPVVRPTCTVCAMHNRGNR